MVDEVGHQRREHLGVAAGEGAPGDQPDRGGQFRVAGDVVARAVALGEQFAYIVHGESEQEEVLGPGLLAHLDVGAVEGADGQGAVHHELHVAGAGGFLARGRDLLGEVCCGIDQLAVLDVEVRDERHLESAVDVRVVVDRLGDGVDQPDHQLGDEVTRGGLTAENESTRGDLEVRVLLEPVVESDDVQRVEMLALVFVDAFDLNVEHPLRVEQDAGVIGDVIGEPGFVATLHGHPLLLERSVVGVGFQAAQLLQVDHPPLADGVVEEPSKARIGQTHEPARSHPVGLVGEPLRPHLVEVFEDGGLDQFGVHRRDAVDGVAPDGGQVGHPDATVPVLADQRHTPDPGLVAGEAGAHLGEEPRVDFVDDLQVPGQEPFEHLQRPGLQRFR